MATDPLGDKCVLDIRPRQVMLAPLDLRPAIPRSSRDRVLVEMVRPSWAPLLTVRHGNRVLSVHDPGLVDRVLRSFDISMSGGVAASSPPYTAPTAVTDAEAPTAAGSRTSDADDETSITKAGSHAFTKASQVHLASRSPLRARSPDPELHHGDPHVCADQGSDPVRRQTHVGHVCAFGM